MPFRFYTSRIHRSFYLRKKKKEKKKREKEKTRTAAKVISGRRVENNRDTSESDPEFRKRVKHTYAKTGESFPHFDDAINPHMKFRVYQELHRRV